MPDSPFILENQRIVAQALEGDQERLSVALEFVDSGSDQSLTTVTPALCRLALERSLTGSDREMGFREVVTFSVAQDLLLDTAREDIGNSLGEAGYKWLPLKGMDTSDRFFEHREDRPKGDLDVLISDSEFHEVRRHLEESGWRQVVPKTKRIEAYLQNEGYNWKARDRHSVLVEVHYRLWGILGAEFAPNLWKDAAPAPELGPTAFRMSPAWSYVVSAIHSWLQPAPRPLLYWWEQSRIVRSDSDGLVSEIVQLASREGLQLPVGLAAAHVAEVWSDHRCSEIAKALLPQARATERVLMSRAMEKGLDSIPLSHLYMARLLAGRPCRMGWKGVLRRIWPHPGVVEQRTGKAHSWLRRRLELISKAANR